MFVLTGDERLLHQLSEPFIVYLDRLKGTGLLVRGVALLICVLHKSVHIIFMERVQNIEKVRAIWNTAFRQLVWEVKHQLLVVSDHGPNVHNRKFIVERNIDAFDLGQLE